MAIFHSLCPASLKTAVTQRFASAPDLRNGERTTQRKSAGSAFPLCGEKAEDNGIGMLYETPGRLKLARCLP